MEQLKEAIEEDPSQTTRYLANRLGAVIQQLRGAYMQLESRVGAINGFPTNSTDISSVPT
ncbi:hypothetical protein ANCDUO_26094 [Ancylostoma duodenale]|uniref:Uncharacterized protein n=1 Tax=Ancylostoma duodenale TaxID=51022 RepID=A0A0C2BJH0_9BILA|nr:hypothetical protein ANCDUO_26094 [Ancylostoma duodenale]